MPIKSYTVPDTGFKTLSHFANSANNKLPNGRIDTKAQGPLTFQRGRNIMHVSGSLPNGSVFECDDASQALSHDVPADVLAVNQLTAVARAKFDGKLRFGHADLGVTIGSWRQSCDMIANRARQAARSMDNVFRRLSQKPELERLKALRAVQERERKLKRGPKENSYLETPANLVLEGEFGWLPLFSDAQKAFGVMAQPIPSGRVTGRHRGYYSHFSDSGPGNIPRNIVSYDGGMSMVTISANVQVDNPNLWLLNQLGLLNLPGVAWDLVPWSFVANMFSNLGQIANSFTAHVGLQISNASTTYTHRHVREEFQDWTGFFPTARIAHSRNHCSYKSRILGSIPFPPFYSKLPEVNLELAVIAVSLAIQQVSRITRLIR